MSKIAGVPKEKRMDIRTIRRLIGEGKSIQDIADYYGVTRQAVYWRLKKEEAGTSPSNTTGYSLGQVRGLGEGEHRLIDPETGLVVQNTGAAAMVIGRMGDEKVTAFVRYHMDMLAMRQGVDKRNVPDLYRRFAAYLDYCAEHGVVPNNMNCYFALGVARQDISQWSRGVTGTPEHREFAQMVQQFFASVHEQGSTDGVLNPISAIFWQKCHDNMIEASKVEVVQDNPLGDKKSAEEIAATYSNLPD